MINCSNLRRCIAGRDCQYARQAGRQSWVPPEVGRPGSSAEGLSIGPSYCSVDRHLREGDLPTERGAGVDEPALNGALWPVVEAPSSPEKSAITARSSDE